MPTEAQNLRVDSSGASRREAVSACISQFVTEGRTQEQATAVCIKQADEAMGTKESRAS